MSATGESPEIGQRWQRPRWTTLEDYLTHHDSHLSNLESIYGIEDRLSIQVDGPYQYRIFGRIDCRDGLFIEVEKFLDIRDDGLVCPTYYKYQACLTSGSDVRPLFRYDTDHAERPHPGHKDAFHCHHVDGSVRWVGIENWPTLGDVVVELHQWWESTGRLQGPLVD